MHGAIPPMAKNLQLPWHVSFFKCLTICCLYSLVNDYFDYFYRKLNWKSFYSGLVLIGTVFPKGQRCLFILLICLSLGLSLCFQE